MINTSFWQGKKVFLTGHTGFKGSWLSLWLDYLGASVTGYSQEPPTVPSLFGICDIGRRMNSVFGDIRDLHRLKSAMTEANPDIVIHMAAQPLVKSSYEDPVLTYSTNVMGTVNLFESVRKCERVKAVVNVTTDKCYENNEWLWGYRESEALGGFDPYSNSKACSEFVTASYRNSFFAPSLYDRHGIAIASARAGNVIGGGDWASNRLIPDCINALLRNEDIVIRNPASVRPWQHVLEPLNGYLLLAEKLYTKGIEYGEAWNFGPDDDDAKPVEWIVKTLCEQWGADSRFVLDDAMHPHEAAFLKLDCSKAKAKLGWHPRWNIHAALNKIVEWTHHYKDNSDMSLLCLQQIKDYMTGVEIHE